MSQKYHGCPWGLEGRGVSDLMLTSYSEDCFLGEASADFSCQNPNSLRGLSSPGDPPATGRRGLGCPGLTLQTGHCCVPCPIASSKVIQERCHGASSPGKMPVGERPPPAQAIPGHPVLLHTKIQVSCVLWNQQPLC